MCVCVCYIEVTRTGAERSRRPKKKKEQDLDSVHQTLVPTDPDDATSLVAPSARSSFRMNASRASELTTPNTTSISSKLSPFVSGMILQKGKRRRASALPPKKKKKSHPSHWNASGLPHREKTANPPMSIVANSMKSL